MDDVWRKNMFFSARKNQHKQALNKNENNYAQKEFHDHLLGYYIGYK